MDPDLRVLVDELLVKSTTASTVESMRKAALDEHTQLGIQKDKDIVLLQNQLQQLQNQLNTKKQQNKVVELLNTYKKLTNNITEHNSLLEFHKKNTFSLNWDNIAELDANLD
eukprot:NODE_232_length_13679_cov_0.197349.p9 type:complete len:112 gc:universal NODE_232_length_13679_cov_0.197349:206-541(+)